MRTSQYLLTTFRQDPADADVASQKLMLRSGMIKKVASGIYTWMPLGLRVLQKVSNIVREEMNKSGSLELLMPNIQPVELWQESQRWDIFGPQLLKMRDRHEHDFCYGPTHEEVVVAMLRDELKSYKQLPLNVYQIQTKFRDEIRPRFGVMRSREFLMKDAYSFHIDAESLNSTYELMHATYCNIFDRLGLKYKVVRADSGNIGGKMSQEFHVLADTGEDQLLFSDQSDYAANMEIAEALAPQGERPEATATMEKFATPGQTTIADLEKVSNIAPEKGVKTLIVVGTNEPLVALILRGDHTLNEIKAAKLPEVASPITFAHEQTIFDKLGAHIGSLGPVNLDIPTIVDRDAAMLSDFCCGANEDGFHFRNVNWKRDAKLGKIADIREAQAGDKSPDGKGTLQITRGIEVGHIFQLGDRYSKLMKASVLDQNGKATTLAMGCYGIGISRVVAAAIEQNHDEKGIVWPEQIAPFKIAIIPISMHKSYRVRNLANKLYEKLLGEGIEVLIDDRDERTGVIFTDMELIGIPHSIVISERGIDAGVVEYRNRRDGQTAEFKIDDTFVEIKNKLEI